VRATDSLYARDLALHGIGIAYVFEPLVREDPAGEPIAASPAGGQHRRAGAVPVFSATRIWGAQAAGILRHRAQGSSGEAVGLKMR
jgi:DNA-binding transcriptional LysR family regulator